MAILSQIEFKFIQFHARSPHCSGFQKEICNADKIKFYLEKFCDGEKMSAGKFHYTQHTYGTLTHGERKIFHSWIFPTLYFLTIFFLFLVSAFRCEKSISLN
jgi:hypothetical protein